MIIVILICIIFLGIIILQFFLYRSKNNSFKNLQTKYNKVIGDYRKLESAIIKINEIEKKRIEKNVEIENTPDSNIADILNSILHDNDKS